MPFDQTNVMSKSLIYHCNQDLAGSVVTVTLRYPKRFRYATEFQIRTKIRALNDTEVWLSRNDSHVALQVQLSSYGNLPIQVVLAGTRRQRQLSAASNQRLAPSLGAGLFPPDYPIVIWLQPAIGFGSISVGDKAGLRSTDGYIQGMATVTDLQVVLHNSAAR